MNDETGSAQVVGPSRSATDREQEGKSMARGISADATNSVVDLEIRNSGGNQYGSKRVCEISVRDHVSGQLIVAVPMDADQILAALAGTHHGRMPAWVVPADRRSIIGLKSQHKSIKIETSSPIHNELDMIEKRMRTAGEPHPSHIDPVHIDPGSVVDEWLLDQMQHEGWTEWRITRHNYGWGLHLTKYVDPSTVDLEPWERR